MNQKTVTIIAVITAYLVWLILFVLLIERQLRAIVGSIFGVTITREIQAYTGPSRNVTVVDILDAYRWKVQEPAGLSVRFAIGLLRVVFWALAITLPLAAAILIYTRLRS